MTIRTHSRSALAAVVALTGAITAGPLTPPPGPVTPTMKPLAEVEPRTAINALNTPGDADSLFRITQPGSYYLPARVLGQAGKHGVEIAADNVTIDLNGFEVAGVTNALSGIRAEDGADGLVVRNGTVRDWPLYGVMALGEGVRLSDLRVVDNAATGLWIGSRGVIADCVVSGSEIGVEVGVATTLRGVTSTGNAMNGFLLGAGSAMTDCVATGNQVGIQLSFGGAARGCTSAFNRGAGFISGGATISCTAHSNQGSGFVGGDLLRDCVSKDNGEHGFDVGGATVEGCLASHNARHGIRTGDNARLARNTASSNGVEPNREGYGIIVEGNDATVSENSCSDNDRGIVIIGQRNRIDDNHLADNRSYGLVVGQANNIVTRNTARSTSGSNWNIAAGNRGGAFIVPPQTPAINGSSGGSGSGTTDPYANLSF